MIKDIQKKVEKVKQNDEFFVYVTGERRKKKKKTIAILFFSKSKNVAKNDDSLSHCIKFH